MKEYRIFWSPRAEETYLKILEYILLKWSQKEAEDFEDRINRLIDKLRFHKNLCPPSLKKKQLRKCVVTSQTSLVYRTKKQTIEIVALIDNRSQHNY
jgi:plasmid stabilization system protein ParE